MTPEAQARVAEQQRQMSTEPQMLDDLLFTPDAVRRSEMATCEGEHIGDVLLDDEAQWFARKLAPNGEWAEWKHVRSAAEARAFIVSKVKQ